MFDGSVLYDESRMDALEKRSDELYKELYGKEWFGKLNRYDRILGDAGEAVKEFYRNTAGEIEARDTTSRRRMNAEERKNTPPNLGDADTVFADGNTTSYSIDENFRKNVDDWVKNTPEDMLSTSHGYFRVGTTSEALKSIGARTDNIYMRKSKIGTIFEDHPEVTVDVIKKVPDILENPVLIMKSLTRSDSIVLLSEKKAENGNSLMVALELTPKPGGRTEAEFSLVTSAYGRNDENLRNLINNSELLYLDTNKNRANTWLMQLRVQFPSGQPPYGSIGNIAYSKDGVKITGKKLSELGGVIQKASSGRASVEVSGINNRTAAELRREYERRMQEYQKAMQRDDQSYPYIAEMKWIQAAERRLAELGDGKHRRRTVGSTKRKRTYEPIQTVGEYTERLVRMESALETADTAVMEEGKNRYEARITEEDGYVYAYCGQRKTRFMSIHSSAPQSVGSAAASAVHVQLPVSFFTERSVVEHGQCISVKTITHAAVFSVQPFASNIALIAEAESVRFSVPSAI